LFVLESGSGTPIGSQLAVPKSCGDTKLYLALTLTIYTFNGKVKFGFAIREIPPAKATVSDLRHPSP
jgi:hypothetical protein